MQRDRSFAQRNVASLKDSPAEAALAHALRLACAEARKWLGATSPNPPVGAAALDAEGHILALTAHQRAGGPHAEAVLLDHCRQKGLLERLHTLCVTLEPCNHQGRTPPCCESIIAAGIQQVVVGTRDPNPHVPGGGLARLRAAGIKVVEGLEEELCRQLIYAFAHSAKNGTPWITLKRALNAEGSMIPPKGQKTFMDPASLRLAHLLRKRADAILTGSGTLLADNPLFTVRHVPDYAGKTRVLAVLDRRRRVPADWLKHAEALGFTPILYDDAREAVRDLGRREMREILVEAGPTLSDYLLENGLWTQGVTLRQGEPAKIEVEFNPQTTLPFDVNRWQWENTLPNEGA